MAAARTRVLYIRVPAAVHDAVRELADDLGVSMTDAVALTLRLLLLGPVRQLVIEAMMTETIVRQAPLAELQPPAG